MQPTVDTSHFLSAVGEGPEAPSLAVRAQDRGVLPREDRSRSQLSRELRKPTDLDLGPLLPVDPLLAGFDPSAHLIEDLFRAKIGFVTLLNYPQTTLAERLAQGPSYTRQQWAEVRLSRRFSRRVPAEIQQGIAETAAKADLYIAEYNIWMHHLLTDKGERLFPRDLRLISHWNLRDELKADYAKPQGIEKQRMIAKVMERIVTQTIPAAVIDNPPPPALRRHDRRGLHADTAAQAARGARACAEATHGQVLRPMLISA